MTSNARKSGNKFFANWKGPFYIVKDIANGAYMLDICQDDLYPILGNVTHLKFYFS